MYHAKERGGGAVIEFDESIRTRVQNRFDTERALRAALDRGELDVAYQPMVDLKSGRIFSVEALLRWDDPERGEILPGEFIDLAEETGLIVPIGSFVLERACAQVAEWRSIPGAEELHLSVNVSPVQLLGSELKQGVRSALTAAGLPPETLTLEITESLLIEDSAACLDRLHTLKGLGIRLSVDDFGTRYSSLGYLNRMPLDGMKIDRTFVHRLGGQHRDNAIVSAIVAMADGLDLWVVAEGIESEDQRMQLLELGCRYGQGFMFAKPERADAVSSLVRAGAVPIGDALR
jgi:EAL domain-containing protein (putative c-di-GMP-specific phosphodiesterase class I)